MSNAAQEHFGMLFACALLLGASSLGESLGPTFENRRTKPRHGTTRSLSVVALGAAMLAAADRFPEVIKQLTRIISRLKSHSALFLILRI